MKNTTTKYAVFLSTTLIVATFNVATAGITPPPPVLPPDDFPQVEIPQLSPPSMDGFNPVFRPYLSSVGPRNFSNEATRLLEEKLRAATTFCGRMSDQAYIVDCLGDAYEKIAKEMPKTGDYAEARVIIAKTATKLRSLAKANQDTDLPRGYVVSTGKDKKRSSTPLTPIKTETMKATHTQAIAIIEEAQTELLRSAENSTLRKVHYEQISKAIDSNKVLLRSA